MDSVKLTRYMNQLKINGNFLIENHGAKNSPVPLNASHIFCALWQWRDGSLLLRGTTQFCSQLNKYCLRAF